MGKRISDKRIPNVAISHSRVLFPAASDYIKKTQFEEHDSLKHNWTACPGSKSLPENGNMKVYFHSCYVLFLLPINISFK